MNVYGIAATEHDTEEQHPIAVRRDTWLALEGEAKAKGWTVDHLVGVICEAHVRHWV